jgi:hypothetical protein
VVLQLMLLVLRHSIRNCMQRAAVNCDVAAEQFMLKHSSYKLASLYR